MVCHLRFKENPSSFCHMPFGKGPHSCVGMAFAVMEVKLALLVILRKYKFVKAPTTEVIIMAFQTCVKPAGRYQHAHTVIAIASSMTLSMHFGNSCRYTATMLVVLHYFQ